MLKKFTLVLSIFVFFVYKYLGMGKKTKIISPYVGFQENFARSNVDVCFGGGQLGAGKLLPLNSKVLTPNGWVQNGDLQVGNYVSTPFGKPAKILQIFNHKAKDIYRLETSDGRVAECGLEHLWAIRTEKQKAKYNKHKDFRRNYTVCTTEYLLKMFYANKKTYIPIPYAQEFSEKEFVIPPYVLGVLLGDGCISDKTLNRKTNSITVSNTEEDIVMKLYSLMNCTGLTRNKSTCSKNFYTPHIKEYKDYLNSVGLNVKSYDKFIPEEYLWGSIEQRKELLFGLMDTDGCVREKNKYSFSTTSEKLCNDFVYLCRSLGYIATVSTDKRAEKYTSGISFIISIHTNDVIFSSEKHLSKYKKNLKQYPTLYKRTNDHVYITSIEKVGVSDARCIFIDDDMHLYITEDFITTHNSFGAILACAEPSLDPGFKACFLRTNLDDFKAGGGLIDNIKQAYGDSVVITTSKKPRATFASGAFIECMHVANQTLKALEDDFKGTQYDMIYYDELTNFEWETFCFLFSRNRGEGKWTHKIRATTNPKRNHWVRTFIDWYVGLDGRIIEDRSGVVRYFFNAGNTVKDVVWGNSKEEVYMQNKGQIDTFLKEYNKKYGTATYKDVILSFTFYVGSTSENNAIDTKYAGSIAAMGATLSAENAGNWNVDTNNEENCLSFDVVQQIFLNEPAKNGDKWVTCDLADVGTDNFIAIAWNGFHIEDILILNTTKPKDNAEYLQMFAIDHDVPDNHIIYDAIRARYINDYIPDAMPYISNSHVLGVYGRMYSRLKDECYARLVDVVKRNNLSIDDNIARREYKHKRIKTYTTIQSEILDEFQVITFREVLGGKKALIGKKELNAKLGKERSMDIADACAMRMFPVLEFPYGEELSSTIPLNDFDEEDEFDFDKESIFDKNNWY